MSGEWSYRTTRHSRVAVIGDVGGHLDQLRGELRRLGADPATGRLPGDLTVVQVGDLVHRGPASDEVVALVDGYLTRQPNQWVQLVGNHEAQYLRDPVFEWPEQISHAAQDTLRRWWTSGQMRVATWAREGTENFLITHAGVTSNFWRVALGEPATAKQAANTINSMIRVDEDSVFRAGVMLDRRPARRVEHQRGGQRHSNTRGVGPVWAATGDELLPSWLGSSLPFSQIHGHNSIFDWQRRRFWAADDAGNELVRRTALDEQARHEITTLPGGRIIGIDPGHGSQPASPWRAWEIRR